jgi:hypothetical protein
MVEVDIFGRIQTDGRNVGEPTMKATVEDLPNAFEMTF